MLCYRAVDTTADEEGGGRDEEYEIKALRKTVGSGDEELSEIAD